MPSHEPQRRFDLRAAILLAALSLGALAPALAVGPPDRVNYQGVLRDASGAPRNGSFDMTLRFYDAALGGNEILVDRHLAAGSGAVTVSDGLFGVELGSGTVSDGAALLPGDPYTTLGAMFKGFANVWMQVEIGAEVLSPRVHVTAAPYALHSRSAESAADTALLGGLPPGSFLDTSNEEQAKLGKLVLGQTTDTGLSYGVESYGAEGGGYFKDQNNSGLARVAWTDLGILALGSYSGGQFQDLDGSGFALVGYGDHGITAYGDEMGGYFSDTDSSGLAYVASSDYGIRGFGNLAGGYFHDLIEGGRAYVGYSQYGIWGMGNLAGGWFEDSDHSGQAYVGYGDVGIEASGNTMGGRFEDLNSSGYAYIANGDRGVEGYGTGGGGQFQDLDGSGAANVGIGHYGITAFGNTMGGYFEDQDTSGLAYVAFDHYGIQGYGNFAGGYFKCTAPGNTGEVWLGDHNRGVWSRGSEYGGYFGDTDSGSSASVGSGIYKIVGTGTVSFVQNHPEDPSKVVVYHAPEASEVAVFTRGSAQLKDGVAMIPLDGTFRWVANPDIGLTAHATPRGVAEPLAVDSVSTSELVVRGLPGSSAAFDYIVWGLRIGFEEAAPVQAKREEAYIPSMKDQRDLYAQDDALRSFNALERFRGIEERVHGNEKASLDLSRAAELVARIGEYDPAVHGELGGRPAEEVPAIDLASSDSSKPVEPPPGTGPVDTSSLDRSAVAVVEARRERRGEAEDPDRTARTWLPVGVPIEAGDVLAFDIERPGELRPAASMADPGVVGIAAGPSRAASGGGLEVPLVEARYGEVKADAGYGAIRPGDLLVASPTPGHAMRAIEVVPGTVLGKAIDPLDAGTGTIRVQILFR